MTSVFGKSTHCSANVESIVFLQFIFLPSIFLPHVVPARMTTLFLCPDFDDGLRAKPAPRFIGHWDLDIRDSTV